MPIEPSYRTAAIAGVWSALGMIPFYAWLGQDPSAAPMSDFLAWFIVLTVFLFLPGYFLVVGSRATRFGRDWLSDPAERQRYLAIVKRVLVWVAFAAVAGLGCSALLGYFRQ